MHCSPKQQYLLAKMLAAHVAEQLLTFDELTATGRASSLTPIDLQNRVLVKGKVRLLEHLGAQGLSKRSVCDAGAGKGSLKKFHQALEGLAGAVQSSNQRSTGDSRHSEISAKSNSRQSQRNSRQSSAKVVFDW
eukprot:848771-Prymnesium_polylepis.1